MDATYKTTKYEIPLFFISVKTNVGYSIAADFIIQEETIEQISEALQVLKSWNPDWKPPYFMTDYRPFPHVAELLRILRKLLRW